MHICIYISQVKIIFILSNYSRIQAIILEITAADCSALGTFEGRMNR